MAQKNNKTPSSTIVFYFVFFSLIAATLIPYIYMFGKLGLSDNQSIWSDFGSYVGGTLGAIFGAFTIILLIYYRHIDKVEKDQEDLNNKREKYKIVIFSTIEELRFYIDLIGETIEVLNRNIDKVYARGPFTALSTMFYNEFISKMKVVESHTIFA